MPKQSFPPLQLKDWVCVRDLLLDINFRKEHMCGHSNVSIATKISNKLSVSLTPVRLVKAVKEFSIPPWAKPNASAPATQAQARKLFGLIRQVETLTGIELDWDAHSE